MKHDDARPRRPRGSSFAAVLHEIVSARLVAAALALLITASAKAQRLVATPYEKAGIYGVGETVGWTIAVSAGEHASPGDFDAFWASKIAALDRVPVNAVVTPKESAVAGVEYSTFRLDNVGGAHVYGQMARPMRDGKFPALMIFQWARPPYPLDKQWVTDRAAEGWLAVNVDPDDVPSDMPQAFYDALPQMIKEYQKINGHRSRPQLFPPDVSRRLPRH